MKKDVEEIIRERIEENKNLFTEEELKIIINHLTIFCKIYLIGILDGI